MIQKKSTALFTVIILLSLQSAAQLTAEQRIQDSVIGWWSNTRFDHLKPQTDPLAKKKEAHVNKILEWVKKTYTPVAGLGTYSRYINKLGYGVLFEVWNVSHDKDWTEANGNFKPIAEENTPFWVGVNKTFGSFAIPFLQKENEYYFTMQPDGYAANDQVQVNGKKADPRIHPNVYKYVTWCNDWQTVYLTPNNKLPFIALTKGELLQKAEEGLDKQWADEIKDVQAKWPDNKKTQDEVLVIRKQSIEKYRSNIKKLRERHQSTLNEPAVIRDMQPTMYSFELDPDIFKIDTYEKGLKHQYQVYKVDPALYAKMQTDVPQWVGIAFPYANKEKGNQLNEMYTALSQNFNYEYAYNYFFDPEKVKGIAYKPANEEQLTARLNDYRRRNAAAIKPVANPVTALSNAFFFDDFSSGNEGDDPANWFFRKYGKHAVIATIKNQPGKWLQLGYNTPVNPSLLKKPIPENFTLEYDMVTDGDFDSRTGGAISLSLNSRPATADGTEVNGGNGTKISMDIISGNERDYDNNNYRGLVRIKINSTPEVNQENYSGGLVYEYPLREFTNKKTKIHVALTVKNNVLTVLINNKPVAVSTDFKMTYGGKCISCGVPAGTKFHNIFWSNITDDADNIKVYMSNVKITKE
ncbi:hypothetical protein [Ferruginibacter profundus]